MTEKTAWRHFSKYIRTRDCLETTGNLDVGRCFTCGAYKPIQELDAGHFIKSTHKMIKFDPRNVHSQCTKCNHFMGGNEGEYYPRMVKRYGQKVVDELMSKKGIPNLNMDFDEIGKLYREKYKELVSNY